MLHWRCADDVLMMGGKHHKYSPIDLVSDLHLRFYGGRINGNKTWRRLTIDRVNIEQSASWRLEGRVLQLSNYIDTLIISSLLIAPCSLNAWSQGDGQMDWGNIFNERCSQCGELNVGKDIKRWFTGFASWLSKPIPYGAQKYAWTWSCHQSSRVFQSLSNAIAICHIYISNLINIFNIYSFLLENIKH